jgi:hypothetical protein
VLRWLGTVLLALVGAALVIDGFWWLGTIVSNHGGNELDTIGFLVRVALFTAYGALVVHIARAPTR